MSILDVEEREEEGIELSGIILICILLLSIIQCSIPTVSGAGSTYCGCKLPNCGLNVHKCGHSPCPYADAPCGCGCGISRRDCPEGDCGSTPQPKCPNAPCQPGSCPSIPGSLLCRDISCSCKNGTCDGKSLTLTCSCGRSNCGCAGPWIWKCDKTGDCKVASCYCGCSKPVSGPGKCGHGQCGDRAQEGCELYCKCACGNNIIECGGQQCGSPQTPKPGCPSYDKYCECRCGKPVEECGQQCGGSPIPGCSAYIEICECGCKDDVETCKGGQCGSKPKTGCINYVENCNCGCKKTAQECAGGQCGDEPQPGCPSSKEFCRCPCKMLTNLCKGRQCGNLPMPGCTEYGKDCDCSCKQSISECGQQCGKTPQPGCVKRNCLCPCNSTVESCGFGQCNAEPVSGCKLKPEKGLFDYFSDYGWDGWEMKNPDGSTTKVLGLNPDWKFRTRAEYFDKGKGEWLGFKAGINPALVKDVPTAFGVKGTFLGGELDGRLTSNEAGWKAMAYGGKFDRSLDFVPVVGKYCKASVYLLAAGGKAVVDWKEGKTTVGAAALIGGAVEVNWKDVAKDALKWLW